MDLEGLCWFAEVTHANSFAGAARKLKVPSSTVSRRVAKLEQSMGVKLLLRTTRSLSLTDDGERLLPLAEQVLEASEQLEAWQEQLQQEPSGTLRLTAPAGFARGLLTQWLISYRQRYPEVSVELIHSNDYLDFQQHRLDFAFRQGPLPDSTLVAKRLFALQYGVFASPKTVNQHGAPKFFEGLADKPLIATGSTGKVLTWPTRDGGWKPTQYRFLFEDLEQGLEAAAANLGYCLANLYLAQRYLDSGELVKVLEPQWPAATNFYLVYPSRSYLSPKASAFVEHVHQQMAKLEQQPGVEA